MKSLDARERLKRFIAESGGQKAAAAKLGVSPQFVCQMFHGQKSVPDATLDKLGLRRVVIVISK